MHWNNIKRAEKGKDNVVERKGCRVAKGPTGSLGNAWTVRTEWTEAKIIWTEGQTLAFIIYFPFGSWFIWMGNYAPLGTIGWAEPGVLLLA